MLNTPNIPICRSCSIVASWDKEAYRCPSCGEVCASDPSGGPLHPDRVVSRAEIIEYAKTWLGVPYRHLGRSRENGIDCIGLLRCIAGHFGLSNHDYFNYAPTPDGVTLIREMDRAFGVDDGYTPGRANSYEPGDVLAFWIRKKRMPKHVGIYVELDDGRPGMIHTYSNVGKVTMHGMSEWWSDRIAKVYRWPGVE